MKTTKKNAQTVIRNLVEGFVVVDENGNEWITDDLDKGSNYVYMSSNSKFEDWPLEDMTISTGILEIPDELGTFIELECRWAINIDCSTPYKVDDLMYFDHFDDYGFIQKAD